MNRRGFELIFKKPKSELERNKNIIYNSLIYGFTSIFIGLSLYSLDRFYLIFCFFGLGLLTNASIRVILHSHNLLKKKRGD